MLWVVIIDFVDVQADAYRCQFLIRPSGQGFVNLKILKTGDDKVYPKCRHHESYKVESSIWTNIKWTSPLRGIMDIHKVYGLSAEIQDVLMEEWYGNKVLG